jgi:hypothetical protein
MGEAERAPFQAIAEADQERYRKESEAYEAKMESEKGENRERVSWSAFFGLEY